ncbi:MAG: ribosome biogenesis factor YjgA [Myxococcota bacterium]|nr:ribosome biogenesis factor YjgA [Myxococcota bacterium]
MSRSGEADHENGSGEEPAPLSRTQMRREAQRVHQLVLDLIALPSSGLDAIGLDPSLREAIHLCQGLKLRAQARQKRLIAQLLRAEDYQAIRRTIKSEGRGLLDGTARERENELWRSRLIDEGDPALQEFVQLYPEADRQQIRTFVRSAGREPKDKKALRAQRELLRVIRALRVGHS